MLVDIITGFLGAGKTTLINKLINIYTQRGEKLVVIENEYGSVNIDKYLFEDENIAVYEMTSGCLCCTLKGNLEASLLEIRDQIKPDRVIIEPSGIFVIDEMLAFFNTLEFRMFEINHILTVVDSLHFTKYGQKYNGILGAQIKSADVIIVSKCNEQTDTMLIEKGIKAFNKTAPIVIKPWDMFSKDELESFIDKNKAAQKKLRRKITKNSGLVVKTHEVIPHQFKSEMIAAQNNYTKEEFSDLINMLRAKNILRCKGFINVENKGCIFQYVNGAYTLEPAFGMIKENTLVMIGDL